MITDSSSSINFDINALQSAYTFLKSIWLAPVILSVLLVVGLFFLNFKKKNGFVYMAIAFILVGLLLLPLKSIVLNILTLFVPTYAVLIEPLLAGVLSGFQTFAIVYLVLGVICIVLQIVLPKICKKEEKVTENAAESLPEETPVTSENMKEEVKTNE